MYTNSLTTIDFAPPTPQDGFAISELVKKSPPLDPNSVYCNLIQCTHFSSTAVVAKIEGRLIGFTTGHKLPQDNSTLFIWQVCVSEEARGQGLAIRMMENILSRDENKNTKFIETTITKSNKSSSALFEKLAKKLEANLETTLFYDKEKHFSNQHDSEYLFKIGPFQAPQR